MSDKGGSDSELTASRIRAAAQTLVARHGFAAVSMRQIAREAGVQVGTLYLHLADKQSLLLELMDTHLDTMMAAWQEVGKAADPTTQLRAFVNFHIGYLIDLPEEVVVANMESRNLTPENLAVIEDKRKAYERELEAILEQGCAAGDFNISDIRLTTMAILAMLNGVNAWYREGGRLTRTKVARIHWRLVRRMVWAKGLGQTATD